MFPPIGGRPFENFRVTIKNSGGVDGAKTNLGAVGHGPIGKSKHKTKKGGRIKTSAGAQQASAVSVSSGKSPLFRFLKKIVPLHLNGFLLHIF